MAEFSCEFWLPFPPSANRLWRHARGKVYLAPNYIEWKKKADVAAYAQKLVRFPVLGTYVIEIHLSSAFKRFGDADNRGKAVNDWCQHAGLIVNDRYCIKSSQEWDSAIEHDCTVILRGTIAYADRDEFARHQLEAARKRAKKKASAKPSYGSQESRGASAWGRLVRRV